MDATTRLLYIGNDVDAAMINRHINYHHDISKRFQQDLGLNLGGFQTLLNDIEALINQDHRLALLHPLDWKSLKGDPASGQTFSQYYWQRSVAELIRALDWVMAHSPYTS